MSILLSKVFHGSLGIHLALSFTLVAHSAFALKLMASTHLWIKSEILTITAYKALHDLTPGSLSKLIYFHYSLSHTNLHSCVSALLYS